MRIKISIPFSEKCKAVERKECKSAYTESSEGGEKKFITENVVEMLEPWSQNRQRYGYRRRLECTHSLKD